MTIFPYSEFCHFCHLYSNKKLTGSSTSEDTIRLFYEKADSRILMTKKIGYLCRKHLYMAEPRVGP